MPSYEQQRPPRDLKDQKTRPLSRGASRVFVTGAILLAFAGGIGGGYYLVEKSREPGVQERIQTIQRLEAELDSVGRATEAVPPESLRQALRDSLEAR